MLDLILTNYLDNEYIPYSNKTKFVKNIKIVNKIGLDKLIM